MSDIVHPPDELAARRERLKRRADEEQRPVRTQLGPEVAESVLVEAVRQWATLSAAAVGFAERAGSTAPVAKAAMALAHGAFDDLGIAAEIFVEESQLDVTGSDFVDAAEDLIQSVAEYDREGAASLVDALTLIRLSGESREGL